MAAESLVGLCIERAPDMVIALLGILKAGGAYVPLDPAYPQDRLHFMVNDAGIKVLLSQTALGASLPNDHGTVVNLDASSSAIAAQSPEPLAHTSTPDHLAYAIYTSGSTGQPKGVMGLHRGVLNRVQWMQRTYPFTISDVCCQKTALSFVDSVTELLAPLLSGILTVIIPDDVAKDPYRLVDVLTMHRVSRLVFVPSLLRAILDADIDLQARLPHLTYWWSGGEALSAELAQRFRRRAPHARLLNIYGSSEVSADATWHDCSSLAAEVSPPIGGSIDNTQVYILDSEHDLVPRGVSGELYVGGACLARGYLNRPRLTSERFLPNPFSADGATRLFRTGDLGRMLPDGNIAYLGRLDHQVQIRGMRLELGEIEAAIAQYPGVREAVVTAPHVASHDTRLAAYVVGHQPGQLRAEALRNWLTRQLTVYMIPNHFLFPQTLPRTPNGKIDRERLSESATEDVDLTFPSHRAGLTTPLQPSPPAAPRSNEFPGCPSIFQSGCICCGRLVSASNMQACIVNEGDQTLHELGAAPVVFRPLVEIDHQS